MARGGWIDTVILGAYEVDQAGSVANWSTADAKRGGIGGAMDLLSGKGDLHHRDGARGQQGPPEAAAKQCTYPLTGKACVSYVVTDLALLRWDGTPLRPRRGGAGVHAAGSDRADGDGRRRRAERSHDG